MDPTKHSGKQQGQGLAGAGTARTSGQVWTGVFLDAGEGLL